MLILTQVLALDGPEGVGVGGGDGGGMHACSFDIILWAADIVEIILVDPDSGTAGRQCWALDLEGKI